jgi:hypothetical protein
MFLKEGIVAASLLIPLLACTVLFLFYIKQEHFRITEFVPSTICNENDIRNHGTLDISFLHDKYLQPSMKVKLEFPDNDNKEGGEEANITHYDENIEETDVETPLTRHRLETVTSVGEEAEYLESKIPYEERKYPTEEVENSLSENYLNLETVVSVNEDAAFLESKIPHDEKNNLAKDFDSSHGTDMDEKHTHSDSLSFVNETNRIASASVTENDAM